MTNELIALIGINAILLVVALLAWWLLRIGANRERERAARQAVAAAHGGPAPVAQASHVGAPGNALGPGHFTAAEIAAGHGVAGAGPPHQAPPDLGAAAPPLQDYRGYDAPPQITGPEITGPQSTGPQSTGPQSTGPQRTGTVNIDGRSGSIPRPRRLEERQGPPPGSMNLRPGPTPLHPTSARPGSAPPYAPRPASIPAVQVSDFVRAEIDGPGVADFVSAVAAELAHRGFSLHAAAGDYHAAAQHATLSDNWFANIVGVQAELAGTAHAQRTGTGWLVAFALRSPHGVLDGILRQGAQRSGFAAAYQDATVWVGHRPGAAIRLYSGTGVEHQQQWGHDTAPQR